MSDKFFVIKLLSLNIKCRSSQWAIELFRTTIQIRLHIKKPQFKHIQFIVNAVDTNVFNSCIGASQHYRRLQIKKKLGIKLVSLFYTQIVYL